MKSLNSPDLAARSLAALWHPCTQMARAAVTPPLAIARGEGPWLFDLEGRRYFDANSSWWVNLFGHANPRINAALRAQLDELEHVILAGFTHRPVVELSERLAALTGGALGHAFYASDGASATEIALKMSFHSWRNRGFDKKRDFLCLEGSYHGETVGALAVTGALDDLAAEALDLVGRKLGLNGGRAIMALFKEIGDFCEENRGDEKLTLYTKALKKGLNDLQAATMWFMSNAMAKPDNAGAGSTDYMHLSGLVVLGYMWAKIAKAAEEKLAAGDTARAPDGLALSSRNGYLSASERAQAIELRQALQALAHAAVQPGAQLAALEAQALQRLQAQGWQPDYLTVRQRSNLQAPAGAPMAGELVALGAARLGTTRLIDNLAFQL